MLKRTALAVALLAGCAPKMDASIPALTVPLYPTTPPYGGMETARFSGAADTCSIPHYLSASPKYSDAPKGPGVTMARDAMVEVAGYAEGVSCYCYAGSSPAALTHGNHRANAITRLGNVYAGELKIERDTLYKIEGGNRYEFEGTVPYQGKRARLYLAIEAGPTCANLMSVSWDPANQADGVKASRFIQANGR